MQAALASAVDVLVAEMWPRIVQRGEIMPPPATWLATNEHAMLSTLALSIAAVALASLVSRD